MMLYRLLKQMKKKAGYELLVISILPLGQIAELIQKEQIQVHSLQMKGKMDVFVLSRLLALLRQFRPEILHTFMFHADFLGRISGRILGVPVVISSIRNMNIGGRLREYLLRVTDGWADATTIICKTAAERMIKEKVVPSEKLHVIYNGIDDTPFRCPTPEAARQVREELGVQDDEQMLLSVGRLQNQKGYPYALKAAAILKRKGFRFKWYIAGEGEMRSELEAMVREYDLKDTMVFLGIRKDIHRLQWGSDLFVLSSLWEGLPGVVIEAMAAGVPVVATAVGGSIELVDPGETGFLCASEDADALAASIQQALALTSEDRRRMGEAGHDKMSAHFHLHAMVENNEKLYARLLANKGLAAMAGRISESV